MPGGRHRTSVRLFEQSKALRSSTATGSGSDDHDHLPPHRRFDPEVGVAAREVYEDASAPLVHRGHADISRLFTGFDLLGPGVTEVSDWRPERGESGVGSEWWYVGVGRVPGP
jgi:hypothetical protein